MEAQACKVQHATELRAAIGRLANLTSLAVRGSEISTDRAETIAVALATNTSLRSLQLWANGIGDDGAAYFEGALKANTALTSLTVRDNKIGNVGAASFAEALKANATLVSLKLPHNKIGDAGATALAGALKSNTSLTLLSLRGNGIGEPGAAALGEALQSNGTLMSLDLWSNKIGDAGTMSLAEALMPNESLTALDVRDNAVSSAGAAALAQVLAATTTLSALHLRDNNIGEEGAASLAEALKTNRSLTALDLYDNGIGNDGASSLAEALGTNAALTWLNLHKNALSDTGASSLAEALKTNRTLSSLDVRGNAIGDAGAASLAQALKVNTTLSSLSLYNNMIGDAGATSLADALKSNASLTSLGVQWSNNLHRGVTIAIAEALNTNLTKASRQATEFAAAPDMPKLPHEAPLEQVQAPRPAPAPVLEAPSSQASEIALAQDTASSASPLCDELEDAPKHKLDEVEVAQFASSLAMEIYFRATCTRAKLVKLRAERESAEDGGGQLDDACAALELYTQSSGPLSRMADLERLLELASESGEALAAHQSALQSDALMDRVDTIELRNAARSTLLSSLRASLAFPFETEARNVEIDAARATAQAQAAVDALGLAPSPPEGFHSPDFGTVQVAAQEALFALASWKSRQDTAALSAATETIISELERESQPLGSLFRDLGQLERLQGGLERVQHAMLEEIAALEQQGPRDEAPMEPVRFALAAVIEYNGSVVPSRLRELQDLLDAARSKLDEAAAGEHEPNFTRIESCVARLRSTKLESRAARNALLNELRDLEEDLDDMLDLKERAEAMARIASLQAELDRLDAASDRRQIEQELVKERARILKVASEHFPEKRFDESFLLKLRITSGLPVSELCRSGIWSDGAKERDFAVQETLASFGGKTVVRATDPLGKPVVLKRFFLGDEDRQRHFYRQCSVLHGLRNSFVVCVQGVFVEERSGFLVMPYYERGSLDQWLQSDAGRARSVETCKSIACDLLDGLVAMHEAGCVHMDIKPGNVLLTKSGRAVIGDFDGVRRADATATRALHVTLKYLAPEVASGAETAARSSADMFAFGRVLEELFDGVHNMAELVAELCSADPTVRPCAAEVRSRAFFDRVAVEVRDCVACMDKVDRARAACCPQGHAMCQESCLDGFLGALPSNRIAADGAVSCSVCDELIPSSELARLASPAAWAGIQTRLQDQHRADLEREFKARLEAELARGEMELGVRRHWNHITNKILSLSCPRCGEVFADFDACFAITCGRNGCECKFCAWCLQDCGNSDNNVHQHVADCPQNRVPDQGVFGDHVVLEQVWRELRGERLAGYWRDEVARESPELQQSLRERVVPLLEGVVHDAFEMPAAA